MVALDIFFFSRPPVLFFTNEKGRFSSSFPPFLQFELKIVLDGEKSGLRFVAIQLYFNQGGKHKTIKITFHAPRIISLCRSDRYCSSGC